MHLAAQEMVITPSSAVLGEEQGTRTMPLETAEVLFLQVEQVVAEKVRRLREQTQAMVELGVHMLLAAAVLKELQVPLRLLEVQELIIPSEQATEGVVAVVPPEQALAALEVGAALLVAVEAVEEVLTQEPVVQAAMVPGARCASGPTMTYWRSLRMQSYSRGNNG